MKKFCYFILIFINSVVFSQNQREITLQWEGFREEKVASELYLKFPFFSNRSFDIDLERREIFYREAFESTSMIDQNSVTTNVVYESLSESELFGLDKNKIPTDVNVKIKSVKARDKIMSVLTFSPIVKQGGSYKKVKKLVVNFSSSIGNRNATFSTMAIQNSVLATGSWYRFYVEKSGVYRVSKQFLQSLGFNTSVDPRTIKIYGNGGRMLPLLNDTPYPIDLEENAIQFIGENDGVFDDSDYILFYAEGVDTWNEESLTSVNLFSDKSYYYLTSGNGNGKRIQETIQPTSLPNMSFTKYGAVKIYKNELVNVAKLGRRWFGEQFNIEDNQSFAIQFLNLDNSVPVEVKINLASK